MPKELKPLVTKRPNEWHLRVDKDFIEMLGTRSTDPANSRRRRIMTLGDVVAYLDPATNRSAPQSPSDRSDPEDVVVELLAGIYGISDATTIKKFSEIQNLDDDGNALYDVSIEHSMSNENMRLKVVVSTNFLRSNIESNLSSNRSGQNEGVWKIGCALIGIPTESMAYLIANQIDRRRVKYERKVEMMETFFKKSGMSTKMQFVRGSIPPDSHTNRSAKKLV